MKRDRGQDLGRIGGVSGTGGGGREDGKWDVQGGWNQEKLRNIFRTFCN